MRSSTSRRAVSLGVVVILLVAASGAARMRSSAVPCDPDNGSLTLPPGFCATVFADKVGAPRHMVVAPNGDVLVIGNSFATNAEAGGPGKDGRLHRPTGLAQGADGSLYIADDVGGTIYKISYKGK